MWCCRKVSIVVVATTSSWCTYRQTSGDQETLIFRQFDVVGERRGKYNTDNICKQTAKHRVRRVTFHPPSEGNNNRTMRCAPNPTHAQRPSHQSNKTTPQSNPTDQTRQIFLRRIATHKTGDCYFWDFVLSCTVDLFA